MERLRHDGHDVLYVAKLSPSITDEEVLQQANDRGALLVTADKDFGELVFRPLQRCRAAGFWFSERVGRGESRWTFGGPAR